jgi:hypothetical protein
MLDTSSAQPIMSPPRFAVGRRAPASHACLRAQDFSAEDTGLQRISKLDRSKRYVTRAERAATLSGRAPLPICGGINFEPAISKPSPSSANTGGHDFVCQAWGHPSASNTATGLR